MVAMVRPAPGEQVGNGGAGALEVVGVDRGERLVLAAAAADDHRNVELLQQLGQRIVRVDRDQQDAVDPVGGQVLGQSAALAVAADQGEQQLHLGVGERRAHPAHYVGEVRLREEARLGLGDDQGDRVGTVGGQGAGRAVGDVAQFGDGRLHGGAGLVTDPRRAVDHPGHRAPAHPCSGRHLFEGGPSRAPAPAPDRASCRHVCLPNAPISGERNSTGRSRKANNCHRAVP